jgi:hypothetical protein
MTDPAFPEPAFMADEEIRIFADSVGRFLDRNAPPGRVANGGRTEWSNAPSGARQAKPGCSG